MQKLNVLFISLDFCKPLLIFGISEILYSVDHITGNVAFIVSIFYAFYKLTKEKNKK